MIRQAWRAQQESAPSPPVPGGSRAAPVALARWGIIEGSIQPTQKNAKTMEAERINALSALLNDLTSRESELRRYL
jgi:hypothetical protein